MEACSKGRDLLDRPVHLMVASRAEIEAITGPLPESWFLRGRALHKLRRAERIVPEDRDLLDDCQSYSATMRLLQSKGQWFPACNRTKDEALQALGLQQAEALEDLTA